MINNDNKAFETTKQKKFRYALTTIDNPFDPFTQWEEWFMYDMTAGHNCCGYLDRIAKVSDAFSPDEIREEISRAIDEIIRLDFMNIYKKVRQEVKEDEADYF